ncbi:unnamed protein product [Albugo candida]|uniref:RRM domain-containing protein n=1 Tax=Albugo candida TaxID=65357 RepID=A0A024GT11_9STRA|nr:unnamed protein product [Albugo candida]|eukprot:CCI49469.1 unnamed protein product [Albugo candida]
MARELSSSPQDTEDRSPSDPHKNTSDAIKRNSMDNGNDRESKSISASPFSSPQAAKQNCQSRSPSMASAGEGIDSRMKRFDGIELPERKDSENNISSKKNGIAVRVGNLTRNVNKEHLTEIFAKFGNVTRVKLMTERGTRLSKGSALIDFETEEDAEKAIEHMHDGWLDGKKVTVLLVTDDPVGEEEKACDKSSVENGHTGKNDARDSRKRSSSVRNGRDSHGSPRRISRPSSTRPDSNFAKNRRGFPGRKHGHSPNPNHQYHVAALPHHFDHDDKKMIINPVDGHHLVVVDEAVASKVAVDQAFPAVEA